MKAEHYFLEISNSIKELASMGDLLVYEQMKKSQHDEIYHHALVAHCFFMGFYGVSSPILQDFLERDFDFSEDKKKKTKRKNDGAFFTPPYISEYICKETLSSLINERKSNFQGSDLVDQICELKICDPAMGAGIFLVCAHDYLMRELILIDQNKYSLELLVDKSSKCIFGVDINPKTVELAKLMLQLNIAKWKSLNLLDEYVLFVEKNLS